MGEQSYPCLKHAPNHQPLSSPIPSPSQSNPLKRTSYFSQHTLKQRASSRKIHRHSSSGLITSKPGLFSPIIQCILGKNPSKITIPSTILAPSFSPASYKSLYIPSNRLIPSNIRQTSTKIRRRLTHIATRDPIGCIGEDSWMTGEVGTSGASRHTRYEEAQRGRERRADEQR